MYGCVFCSDKCASVFCIDKYTCVFCIYVMNEHVTSAMHYACTSLMCHVDECQCVMRDVASLSSSCGSLPMALTACVIIISMLNYYDYVLQYLHELLFGTRIS